MRSFLNWVELARETISGMLPSRRAHVLSAHPVRRFSFAALAVVAAFGFSFAAGPAYALSSACALINTAWGGGRTVVPPGDGTQGYLSTPYTGFADGEELFYTATSSGSSSIELSSAPFSNSSPPVWGMTDEEINYFEYYASGSELSVSGTVPLVSSETYYPYAYSGSNSGVLHVQMGCRLASAATTPDAPTIGAATSGVGEASVTFTAPSSNGGAAITGYTVTASPGGATGTGTASPITVTGLNNGTAYTFTVKATNSVGPGSASAASNSVTPKGSQTITFTNPGAQDFGTTPTLSATSTSGLTVDLTSSTTGVCTISGGSLIFNTIGTCTIDADQGGDGSYLAATTVSQSFTVNAVAAGAPTIGTATAGSDQATISFTAPASNGGASITGYTVTSSPAGISASGTSSPITVTGLNNGTAYTFTVTATNSVGPSTASAASNSVTPQPIQSSQTITFTNPGAQDFGTTPTLSATSTSGLTVDLTSATTGVCTISGGSLTFNTIGTCTIDADQAGDGSYLAATTVSQSFTVNAVAAGAPTIGTATAGSDQATISFTAPASNGGASITGYTVTSSPAGISASGTSSPITVTGLNNGTAYTFTVTATNSVGPSTASAASNSVTPQPIQSSQTITFTNPGAQDFGTTPTLSATSTSGLTVDLTSTTTGVCTISGGSLTFNTIGTCTIDADQAGDGSYLAATTVSQSFTVNAVAAGAPTIGTATAGSDQATISFTAPASNGGASITGYTVTSSPAGISASGTSSPITVTGLNNGTAYTFTVKATNSVGPSTASAASNSVTPQPIQSSQTITFTNPGAQDFGTTPTLSATSTSGLTVDLTSSTTGVCTISGGSLIFNTIGTCTIDADQGGDGSYLAATTVSQSFTVNAVAAGAPTIGTATAGSDQATISFTAPASNGGASITGYTVTSSPAGISASGTSSPITVTGLNNGTAYTFTVTATNSVGPSTASAASNSVTPQPIQSSQTITFTNPGAQDFGTTPTLSAASTSGLTVDLTSTTTGVCTISGGSLTFNTIGTCTIDADQGGDGSYLAATTVSQSFTVNAVAAGAPTIGTATAGDGEATVSFTAPASSGGAPITGYTVTSSPDGITATGTTSPITITGLENGTVYTFTVTATTNVGPGSASAWSNSITPVPGLAAPIANAVSGTVAANSSANPISLSISGGSPDTVDIGSQASHGTATASGLSITYTPDAGYSGTDSFTYTATNDTGTSSAATVTITVTAPTFTFSPSAGALPAGDEGSAYTGSISASGGTGPYHYIVTTGTLPDGLSLSTGGVLSGTPTASGNYSFVVTATDSNDVAGTATYSLQVNEVDGSFVFVPAVGALSDAMAGEDYSQQITATGGNGALIYSLLSGTMPDGMILNVSTGQLSGPLDADTEGNYSFTIKVEDSHGATGSATYTLTVAPREVTVADKVVNVKPGSSPADVYLNAGATGGPFTAADLTFVEPSNAGTANIIQGRVAQAGVQAAPSGWYLQFTPNPAYSGQVRVGFRLKGALGISNTGTVIYNLGYNAAEVAQTIDGLVHDFVQNRQNMIASTIKVSSLLERRMMEQATDSVTARMMPTETGLGVGFSTSLAQMEAAQNRGGGYSEPFNIWIDGAFLGHNDVDIDNGAWGSFSMVNMGADYLFTDKALFGISLHYDRMTDPTDEDATLTGNGWLAGPYASFEIGKNVFWNASLLYGGSTNDIDTQLWDGKFETRRWMADTSIEGQLAIGEATVLTPKLRVVYFAEKVEDYSVSNGSGDEIAIDGFNEEQFRVSLGAEIARAFSLDAGGTLTPKLGLTGGFSALDGSGAFGSVTAGVTYMTANQWMLDAGVLVNIEGDGQRSVGARGGASRRF